MDIDPSDWCQDLRPLVIYWNQLEPFLGAPGITLEYIHYTEIKERFGSALVCY